MATLDASKLKLTFSIGAIVSCIGAIAGASTTIALLPSSERVGKIEAESTAAAVRLSVVETQIENVVDSQKEHTAAIKDLTRTVIELRAYAEIQATQSVAPDAPTRNARALRDNVRRGLPPLDGIVEQVEGEP